MSARESRVAERREQETQRFPLDHLASELQLALGLLEDLLDQASPDPRLDGLDLLFGPLAADGLDRVQSLLGDRLCRLAVHGARGDLLQQGQRALVRLGERAEGLGVDGVARDAGRNFGAERRRRLGRLRRGGDGLQ